MSAIDDLLLLARTYAKAHGIGFSTVSWRVFGDTKKLAAIASGRDIQVRRYERAIAWFSANWPTTTPWPDAITRPAHVEAPP